jgi:hypothetical protein
MEIRGRNGWFKYESWDVIVLTGSDEVHVNLYSKSKTCQTPPVMICGSRGEVETLLQTLLDKVKGGAG